MGFIFDKVNEEHLKILDKGAEEWNKWRKENQDVQPTLSTVYLPEADLYGADFHGADLSEAYFRKANLRNADFRRADLRGANLSGTDLTEADLTEADLRGANLSGANLSKANLSKTKLSGTDLRHANLSGAYISKVNLRKTKLSGTDFRHADLSGTDLSEANLRKANLSRANLSEADLSKADLRSAYLYTAFLTEADLTEADLTEADLRKANLSRADLRKANLSWTNLSEADLSRADLSEANLSEADLILANLSGADLRKANLSWTFLVLANLSEANLSGANLIGVSFVGANMQSTNLNKCKIYGVSIWDIKGEIKDQKDLIITPGKPEVTVDNIKVAQFIYMLLENQEIRDVIDTLISKSVLILGRFSAERKKVLDSLKEKLREKGYLPILFDFTRPSDKNMIQTIKTLARLSKYVIVDLTDSRDARREVEAIANINHLPIRPIVLDTFAKTEYSWFSDYLGRETVIWPHKYKSEEELIASFTEVILKPAERKYEELKQKRLEIELRLSKEKTK